MSDKYFHKYEGVIPRQFFLCGRINTRSKVLNRTQLLHRQKRHDKQCIPSSVTYSRSLPNLKDIITKHWHILQANQSCKENFNTLLIIAFRKGTCLKQIIGTNTIHNNEKLIKTKISHHTGKCVPCN